MKRSFLLLAATALLSATTFIAKGQDIYTFAGIAGAGAYGGDGGLATISNLNGPYGMVADASGNIYFADTRNNIVREVSTAGIITTFAGSETLGGGYSGDGGAATAAQLMAPSDVAIDGSGNIYIADTRNNVIRMVNTSGIISTVAGNNTPGYSGDGGAATAAQLNRPAGITINASGNFFIADTRNQVIRYVSGGTINTIAGNNAAGAGYSGDGGPAASAQLNNPAGIVLKGHLLYIADTRNNVIRIVDSLFNIYTIAGTATAGYSGDGGPAAVAGLSGPTQVKADASGNIYIADRANNVVRKINMADTTITTFAGNNIAGYSGDGGLATAAEMSAPQGLAADASGNIYIACSGSNVIRRVGAPVTGISVTSNTGDTVCYNTLFSFAATPIAFTGGTPHYQWLQNGAYVGTDNAIYTPGATFATGDVFNCILYNASGDTLAVSGSLRIDSFANIGVIDGPATFCVGSTANIRDFTGGGPGGGGAGGIWVTTDSLVVSVAAAMGGGPGGPGGGGETATAVALGMDTVYYIASNVCGTDSVNLVITVVPATFGPITGPDSVCAGATATYTDDSTGGVWSVVPAFGGNMIDSLTGVFTAANFVPPFPIVTVISYGTPGCTVTEDITVVALPVMGAFTGTTTIPAGTTTAFSETAPGGTWSSSDNTIATIDPVAGNVYGVATGTANITYSITGLAGCTDDTVIVLTVTIPSGVAAVTNAASFNVYPNPATGNLNITWANQNAGQGTVTIADVSGRTVYTSAIDMGTSNLAKLDISQLKAGVYMVSVQAGSVYYCNKLIVGE